jgi:excisionase family DNA binding protein
LDEVQVLLRPSEAAAALGIGKTALYELLARGELESVVIGVRARRIPRDALSEFVERLRAEAGPR